ncbi:hypothetical protein [Flavobacterium sp.]|uniref:hypothetical protein n=1 Tax=Flavobacterium sp. TaxID=239 RepID=UPI00352926B6
MELLGTYSTERIDTDNYKLTYFYPDNCTTGVTEKDGVYSITIDLQNGQTQPSAKFISAEINCKQYNSEIEIIFIQQSYNSIENNWGAGTASKPKVKIFVNG